MKFIMYDVDLTNGSFVETKIDSIESAIAMFRLKDPVHRSHRGDGGEEDLEYSLYTLTDGQGWMASRDEGEQYLIVFKDEPGIFEHFMKYCMNKERVQKIVCRVKNLENLLD